MPAHRERSHGSSTAGRTGSDHNQQLHPGKAAITTVLGAGMVLLSLPAQAGLLRPMLDAFKPRIERRLNQECRRLAREEAPSISHLIEPTCRSLSQPATECLVEEASRSGRELGVITELLSGRLGDDSEVVIRRCLERLIGINSTTLEKFVLPLLRPQNR